MYVPTFDNEEFSITITIKITFVYISNYNEKNLTWHGHFQKCKNKSIKYQFDNIRQFEN